VLKPELPTGSESREEGRGKEIREKLFPQRQKIQHRPQKYAEKRNSSYCWIALCRL